MNKVLMLLVVATLAFVGLAVPASAGATDATVQAVNTTAIDDMADTIVALLIALIPVLLILAIWTKMKGVWAIGPIGIVMAVNTTGIDDMADTIVALLIALIPVLLILAVWTKMKKIW